MRERIIFDEGNYEFIEDEMELLKEEYPDATEEQLRDWAYDSLRYWYEDEKANLDIDLPNDIVIIANLGLWNGRRVGIKKTNCSNIGDILVHQLNSMSEIKFYCDRYNLKGEETHHDGTNYYTYRMVRPNRDINNLIDKILRGDKITTQIINYYTKSLVKEVNAVYGW